MTAEEMAAEIKRLDWGMMVLALLLVFLLTSFAIRNSDFWLHLASGRLYAHGQVNFGHDPFSYTTAGTYWTNHSWLFDLIVYGLTTLLGGPESAVAGTVLVIAKAGLMTLLAWLMLRIRRFEQGLWIPAACTVVAFLAMSTRLHLQPTLISLIFLGLTLYILQRPQHQEPANLGKTGARKSPLASYWLLPLLFVFWVNLDSWFVLGPATVALYLLGQLLQQVLDPVRTGIDAPEPKQLRTLALVLVVGSAACLLNPHHYHAFELPSSLALGLGEVIEGDALLRRAYTTPFQAEYFQSAVNPVGLAYYVLVAAGLLSFMLSFSTSRRFWRLLIWIAFFLLSAYQVRNMLYFAVVAAPITALNFQDFARARFGTVPHLTRGWKWWSLGGRVATLALGVLLLALVWPGWVHGDWVHGRLTDVYQPFRVSWSIDGNHSAAQAAQQLKAWRAEGLLQPDEQGFICNPELVNYFAWYCAGDEGKPEEKGFFDIRFQAFTPALVSHFMDVRKYARDLAEARLKQSGLPSQDEWQELFRKRHINHVVVSRGDPYFTWLRAWLQQDWHQWTLVYMDGRTSIYCWTDPRRGAGAATARIKQIDLAPLAFGPQAERAPPDGAPRPPEARELWKLYLYGVAPSPLAEARAYEYLEYRELIQGQWPLAYRFGSTLATRADLAILSGISPATYTVLAPAGLMALNIPGVLMRGIDPGPPGAPVLAVRSSRQAIASNPDDPQCYMTLAKSYQMLWKSMEDVWSPSAPNQMSIRQTLRQIEMVSALEHALLLRPDDADAHRRLADLYSAIGYLDLSLEHRHEYVSALEAAVAGLESEQNDRQIEKVQSESKELQEHDTQLKRRQDEFNVRASDQPLINQVQTAMQLGLGKKALELLVQADASQMGVAESRAKLELLLAMGQIDQVRSELAEIEGDDKAKAFVDYVRFKIFLESAAGNYREATQYLDEVIRKTKKDSIESAMMFTQARFFQRPTPRDLYSAFNIFDAARRLPDLLVLRGLLAMEEGDCALAADAFKQALAGMSEGQADPDGFRISRHYLELIEKASAKK